MFAQQEAARSVFDQVMRRIETEKKVGSRSECSGVDEGWAAGRRSNYICPMGLNAFCGGLAFRPMAPNIAHKYDSVLPGTQDSSGDSEAVFEKDLQRCGEGPRLLVGKLFPGGLTTPRILYHIMIPTPRLPDSPTPRLP